MSKILQQNKGYVIMSEQEDLICIDKYPYGPKFTVVNDYQDGAKVRVFQNRAAAEKFLSKHFSNILPKMKVVEVVQKIVIN